MEVFRRINAARSKLGATESRLEHNLNTLNFSLLQSELTAGRIIDADYARESADMAKFLILNDAATAMLSYANTRNSTSGRFSLHDLRHQIINIMLHTVLDRAQPCLILRNLVYRSVHGLNSNNCVFLGQNRHAAEVGQPSSPKTISGRLVCAACSRCSAIASKPTVSAVSAVSSCN